MEGRDFVLAEYPYFSTPVIYVVTCLRDGCTYNTGKYADMSAVAAYYDHWHAKHKAPPDSDE